MSDFSRPSGRAADQLRAVRFERGFTRHAEGSVLVSFGDTRVLVTASVEARAERRLKELRDRGVAVIYAAVLEDMKERDARDSQRAVAPLKPAADAFLLDTSSMDADQALDAAMTFICSKTGLSDHCA
mgnify:CR=1 FL=1